MGSGRGTSKIELVGPDNAPLTFDWDTPSIGGYGYSGTGVDYIDTSGTGPLAQPSLSNAFKFNDRLITARVTIPSTWPSTVAASGGDNYLRLRYTGGSAQHDRTTWGINLGGGTPGSSGGVRLVDPG